MFHVPYGLMIEERLKGLHIGGQVPLGLYEPIEYVMSAGGKRVRPVLTLMACKLFDDEVEKAVMPAIALELFHNFTLMHDDLMDKSDTRRNRPTVHKRWNENAAILSGDAMMILAYQCMCRAEPALLPALLEIFNRTALEVCEGQQFDMDYEQSADVSVSEYLNMIRLKTSVLLAACLKTGAVCGGAEAENAEALYRFGISLGMTFQIQDDWLDVYADSDTFGKAIGKDILCGKKTYLLLAALERADQPTRRELNALLTRQSMPDDEKINGVIAIYNRLNVSEAARQAMNEHHRQAVLHLQNVVVSDMSRKTELENFAESLLNREK